MYLRIIHGKLKEGSWPQFEREYLKVIADVGPIEGLMGRWLTRDVDDQDAGTTISLWATLEAMQAYEISDLLRDKINARLSPFFVGDYRTTRSRVVFAEGDPAPDVWVGGDS